MKKYVIIGNGIAAAGCIEGIRSVDRESAVTVISAEKYPVYCRPLISYYLENKTDLQRMGYRPENFYEEHACTVLYGKKAQHIDPVGKKVLLETGEALAYDALCIAAGSEPFVPPMEGLEKVKEKFTFMTLEDALHIEKALCAESRVLIIGAGLIGLKCAEGLHGKVKNITVCDLSDRILSSILDGESASFMQRHLEENGICFRLGDSVACFEEKAAVMKSGVKVEFDFVVLAVGVRANTALIREIGGACSRGITVDTFMKTSVPDIFAAGDCTGSMDISDKTVKVMALLPNAYMQGRCAGVNMAGGHSKFDCAIPMNSIGFFGFHVMTAGSRGDSAAAGDVYEEKSERRIRKLFIKDGKLIGFELIGDVERAGIYTNLIRTQTPLNTVDFENLKKNPNLFALDQKYRKNILGGVV